MKPYLTALNRFELFILAVSLSPAIALGQLGGVNDDKVEDDPWFSEERESPASESENPTSMVNTANTPRVAFKKLMQEYQRTPEFAISQRLTVLRQARTSARGSAQDEVETLFDEVEARYDEILRAISAAEESDSVLDALHLLQPHARYIAGDVPLRKRISESTLTRNIEREVIELSDAGEFAGLAALESAIVENDLGVSLLPEYKSVLQKTLRDSILDEWETAVPQDERLSGELQLISKALGKNEVLPLSIVFRHEVDSAVSEHVRRSIARIWGDRYEILDTGKTAPSALTLEVDFGRFYVNRDEDEKVKQSIIAGHVKEEPNPEFLELAAKYEKEAAQYKARLEQYEFLYQDYLDNQGTKMSENMALGQRADQLEASLQEIPASGAQGRGMGEFMAIRFEAAALRRQIRDNTIPNRIEPMKPIPYHLETLKLLYSLPSTIITNEGQQDYEYIEREIEITFHGSAELALIDPVDSSAPAKETFELARQSSWIQNLDVHPKDPSAGLGNYSAESVKSSQNLFALEFAGQCAKVLGELSTQKAEALKRTGMAERNLESIVLALSLHESEADLRLDEKQILDLAKKLKANGLNKGAIREACLKSILAHSSIASVLPQ